MKKLILTIFILISAIPVIYSQFTKIGGGLTFGTGLHFNNLTSPQSQADLHRSPLNGIFLTGIYELNLPFHLAPSFIYFIPRTNEPDQASGGEGTIVSEMMFDLNGHAVINSLDRFKLYGLGGLNITFVKLKWIDTSSSGTDNAMGLNLGAGTYMQFTQQFDFYGEIKYIIGRYNQLMVKAGILYSIDWKKKNENKGL